jgi:oligopeptide transport system ATP-binding protein
MNPQYDTPLLEIENLKKHFHITGGIFSRTIAKVYAVDGISFNVKSGETLGLVGESGCGKSTVGKVILRLIESTEGRIIFDGQDLISLSQKEMRRLRQKMTVIFQDPYASLDNRMNVERIVSEPLIINNLTNTKSETQDRVANVLRRVGLRPEHMRRYPHQFSGGQRQRIAIARALVLNPKLIIADEPVSALDVSIQAQVLNLLMDLQHEFQLTYLFIAHDLRVVEYFSTRVAVMYLGKIMELSSVGEIYNRCRHPYTEALLSAIPMPDPKTNKARVILKGDVPSPINPPPGCPFHSRCSYKKKDCSVYVPEYREISSSHYIACHYPIN